MKLKKKCIPLALIFFISFINCCLYGQDTIQKTNGEEIYGKVIEVGSHTISYKKKGAEDGPSYTEELKTVANIRYKNGTREEYKKAKLVSSTTAGSSTTHPATTSTPATNTSHEKLPSVLTQDNSTPDKTTGDKTTPDKTSPDKTVPDNNPLKNGPVSTQYRIEHLDKKYTVNGQKVSSKAVDKLLAKSTNPTVQSIAKTAKVTKVFQKVIKLTSIPSTIGGGVASIATFSDVYKQVKNGGASTHAYVNAGLSFLGTLSLPITSKILKNQRDKLYDKAIDLYNAGN